MVFWQEEHMKRITHVNSCAAYWVKVLYCVPWLQPSLPKYIFVFHNSSCLSKFIGSALTKTQWKIPIAILLWHKRGFQHESEFYSDCDFKSYQKTGTVSCQLRKDCLWSWQTWHWRVIRCRKRFLNLQSAKSTSIYIINFSPGNICVKCPLPFKAFTISFHQRQKLPHESKFFIKVGKN